MHRSATGPSQQPRLNYDILRRVCSSLDDVSDVLSFALTCSALMEDAFRRRLSMSPIILVNDDSINSLHAFIFSNKPARAQHIYGFKLPSPCTYQAMDDSLFPLIDARLVALLEAAVHIQYLSFPTNVNDLVFDAAMKLTTLRQLHATPHYDAQPFRSRLVTFRSPLQSLRIDICDLTDDSISAFFLHKNLTHFAQTLKVLDLDSFQLNLLPDSITTPFTAVRSLKFRTGYISSDFHPLGILLRLFPNLDDTLVLGSLNARLTDDQLAALRAGSEEEQTTHAWPRLDRLVCDAEWAFVYALQCPVRRMDILVEGAHRKRHLLDTHRNNAPRHLHLSLELSCREGWGALDDLIPREAADRLTHLLIFVSFDVQYRWRRAHSGKHKHNRIPWHRLFNKLVVSTKHLRLTHLRIIVDCTVLQVVPNRLSWRDLNRVVEAAAHEPDLRPVAADFLDSNLDVAWTPWTLEYLFLEARGETYEVLRGDNWEVDRLEGSPYSWLSSTAWRRRVPLDDSASDSDFMSSHSSLGTNLAWSSWTELEGDGEFEMEERIAEQEGLGWCHPDEIRQCGIKD